MKTKQDALAALEELQRLVDDGAALASKSNGETAEAAIKVLREYVRADGEPAQAKCACGEPARPCQRCGRQVCYDCARLRAQGGYLCSRECVAKESGQ